MAKTKNNAMNKAKKVSARSKKPGKKVAKPARRATVFKSSSWYEAAARSIGISTSGRYPVRRESPAPSA
jgi:hypothetical protein